MPDTPRPPLQHGGLELTAVTIASYNLELQDGEGFVGDRASKRAFREILEDWRQRLADSDPFGNEVTENISRKTLDALLESGDLEAAGVIFGSIEEFSQEFATVIKRFLRHDEWKGTKAIVVGGGFRNSRIGELAVGRAMILLKGSGCKIDLIPIRNHPDEPR